MCPLLPSRLANGTGAKRCFWQSSRRISAVSSRRLPPVQPHESGGMQAPEVGGASKVWQVPAGRGRRGTVQRYSLRKPTASPALQCIRILVVRVVSSHQQEPVAAVPHSDSPSPTQTRTPITVFIAPWSLLLRPSPRQGGSPHRGLSTAFGDSVVAMTTQHDGINPHAAADLLRQALMK